MLGTKVAPGGPGDVARLLQQGDFDKARQLGSALLRQRPGDNPLLQLTAIAALQSGQTNEGIALLRRALAMLPRDPAIRFNLAKALGEAGDVDEALRMCLPADAEHRRLRADLLKKVERWPEARAAYAELVAAEPDNADLRNNLGTACLADDDAAEAIAQLETARSLAPGTGIIHLNLSKAYTATGRAEDALSAAERAHRLLPDDWRASVEHARALNCLQRQAEALPLLTAALDRNRAEVEIVVDIGLTFAGLAEFDRAEEAYRLALKSEPGNARAALNLGNLLEQDNRLDELSALVATSDAAGAVGDGQIFLKAQLARRNGDLDAARELVGTMADEGSVAPGFRAQLLGQLADRQGDYPAAFAAFAEMNAAARANPMAAGFDGSEYRTYIAGLRQRITPAWIAAWPQIVLPAQPSPAFLVGFPRSGTTLLDTVLMGHPATHVLEEQPVLAAVHDMIGDLARIPELNAEDVAELRDHYFAGVTALGAVPAGHLIIDKLPLNLLRVPLIHRLFPDAKIILALRHPCDSVLSCFMQNFRVNRAMASFWTVEDAAQTYASAFDFWEYYQTLAPLDVHSIRYEDMVGDLAGAVEPLVHFLGLDWDPAMLDFQKTASDRRMIRTPSYAQVTEQIYTRARGRWEHYRAEMAGALPYLAPWAKRYGYGDIVEPV